ISGKDIKVAGRFVQIARLDGDKYKFLDDPEPVLVGLRKSNTRVDLFTFMQKLPETTPKYSYPMEWDNLAVLSVSTFENWWTETIGFKARNKAKQAAKKGVVVKEVPFDDALAHGIWEIYNESPVRQGRRFPHYGKSFESIRQMSSTFLDTSIFIGAYLGEKLIGFIKLTADDSGTQAGMMHIVSMIQHRDKAPTNALVAQAVRSCADRGISHLVYSNFAYGKKERSSLSDFKERNGFQRINLPRYYVPLTSLGSAAFRFGMHHKLVDRLPEPLLAKVRDFRYSWYKYRFPASAQDS
ncbi:MAG: hypothetical protein WBY73_08345, partial [Candidatus Acidiferrales bacterium]